MNDKMLGRREVLAGAGAAGALAVMGGVMTPAAASAATSEVGVGTYFINIHSISAGHSFKGLAGLAPGGVAVGSDAGQPGGSYIGAWEHDGANGVEIRFVVFAFDSKGTNIGYVSIKIHATVSGDAVSGSYVVTLFPNGAPSQQVDHGTFAGHKLAI